MSESKNHECQHLLRKYYGDVVERGKLDELGTFFASDYKGHFEGCDMDFEGLKNLLSNLQANLRAINVEIEKEDWSGDTCTHEILFQANAKSDNAPVEWRTTSKWRWENNKVVESWPKFNIGWQKVQPFCQKGGSAQQTSAKATAEAK